MTTAIIGKWGNSLALRIPGEVAGAARLSDGDVVEITAGAEGIVITPAAPRFTAESLFAGRSAAQWREAYRGAYDWGEDMGREAVGE